MRVGHLVQCSKGSWRQGGPEEAVSGPLMRTVSSGPARASLLVPENVEGSAILSKVRPESVGLRQGFKVCISNRVPGDTEVAGPWTTL